MPASTGNYIYLLIVCSLVLIAGIGEYLHLLPAGTFYSIFFLAIGIVIPSPISHAQIGPNQQVEVKEH